MEFLLVGLTAGAAIAVVRWYTRRRQLRAAQRDVPRLTERSGSDLRVADVVQHLGADYVVEGIVLIAGEGRALRIYRLTDGRIVRYLSVKDGRADLWWLEEGTPIALGPSVPEAFEHAGHHFQLQSILTGNAIRSGSLPDAFVAAPRVRVVELVGAEAVLLVADDHARGLAFLGRSHPAHLFEYLPAS